MLPANIHAHQPPPAHQAPQLQQDMGWVEWLIDLICKAVSALFCCIGSGDRNEEVPSLQERVEAPPSNDVENQEPPKSLPSAFQQANRKNDNNTVQSGNSNKGLQIPTTTQRDVARKQREAEKTRAREAAQAARLAEAPEEESVGKRVYSDHQIDKFMKMTFNEQALFFNSAKPIGKNHIGKALTIDQVLARRGQPLSPPIRSNSPDSMEPAGYAKTETGDPINPFALFSLDTLEEDIPEEDVTEEVTIAASPPAPAPVDVPDTQTKPTTQEKVDKALKKGKVWFSERSQAAKSLFRARFTSVKTGGS